MDDKLLALALCQAGRITGPQARAHLTRTELTALVDAGEIRRAGNGVLALTCFPTTPLSDAYDAVLEVGEPCAAAGLTLGAVLGWPGLPAPVRPEIVVPAVREPAIASRSITIRRLSHWTFDQALRGPLGIPILDTVDGVMTVTRHVDDGAAHTLVQHLAYAGELDVRALWRRRRSGLPGSATLTRVLERYLLGMDSPQEYLVYNVFNFFGRPPDHLNVVVVDENGRRHGPYDGYSEVGVGYQYDGDEPHGDAAQQTFDLAQVDEAQHIGIRLLRITGKDTVRRGALADGWITELDRPRPRPKVRVVHLPGRHCVCGHRAW